MPNMHINLTGKPRQKSYAPNAHEYHRYLPHLQRQIPHLFATIAAGAAYLWKKAVDVAADVAKSKLLKRENRTVMPLLYDDKGIVVRTVLKDQTPPNPHSQKPVS